MSTGESVADMGGAGDMGTIADRLRQARRARFVGRAAELELFRGLLADPATPVSVLFVHGPGGVGKSTLLRRFAEVAGEHGRAVALLDARTLEPSPERFRSALPTPVAGQVLLIDTYEQLAGLDRWVREVFVAELPSDVLVVLAGRAAPAPAWLADPAWRDLLRVVPLHNLRPEDAHAYLRAGNVPDRLRERAVHLSYGHPLALALVVELVKRSGSVELTDSPDLARVLLERFLSQIPDQAHHRTLEVCAHARFTTEDLLRAALPDADVASLFDWLRRLPFIEEWPRGLMPHDLVRDLLDAELRWRDRSQYTQLHRRIRGHVLARVRTLNREVTLRPTAEQQQAINDLMFLHRGNAIFGSKLDLAGLGSSTVDQIRPGDRAAVLAMTDHFEGAESAQVAEHWLDRRPDCFAIFRRGAEPTGFTLRLPLDDLLAEELAGDPGAARLWDYARRRGLRPGQRAVAFRYFIDRDHYQEPSPAWNLVSMLSVQTIVATPGLALDFIAGHTDPEAFEPFFHNLDYHRVVDAEFTVGRTHYGVYAHDFRERDVEQWLELMADRELGATAPDPAPSPPPALARPEFTEAVRQALRDLHRPDALRHNPLLRTRMLRHGAPAEPTPADLVRLVTQAAEVMRADARLEKSFRAIDRTYLRPAPTQERAAEVLDLPFSTYRRHLVRGVERMTELLWHRERYPSTWVP